MLLSVLKYITNKFADLTQDTSLTDDILFELTMKDESLETNKLFNVTYMINNDHITYQLRYENRIYDEPYFGETRVELLKINRHPRHDLYAHNRVLAHNHPTSGYASTQHSAPTSTSSVAATQPSGR